MVWVRIDDAFFHHPKLSKLEWLRLPAVGLHVLALCWCNTNLTNGKLSDDQARILAGDLALLLPDGQPDQIIAALIAAKLWRSTKAGYVIHDYLKYQPSRKQVLEDRKATAIRVQRHRNAHRNAVTPPVTNAVSNALVQPPRTRTHLSKPDPKDQGAPAPSLKGLKDKFFGADAVPAQLGALVDIATLNGIRFAAGHKARLGALLKKHGHGQHVYDVFVASLDKELPIDYATKTLGGQHGQAGRQDSRSRQVTAADLDAAEPIAARARELRAENAARRAGQEGDADI